MAGFIVKRDSAYTSSRVVFLLVCNMSAFTGEKGYSLVTLNNECHVFASNHFFGRCCHIFPSGWK